LKIEPWFIDGWQSCGRFNQRPALGGQILWRFNGNWKIIGNLYGFGEDALGIPSRPRLLTDDSIEYKYHDRPDAISKYSPAEPGALRCEPLKAASMRRLAFSRFLSLLLHLFFP
jgi:Putative beta-barrel porin-2, OmpL-like. bbp2